MDDGRMKRFKQLSLLAILLAFFFLACTWSSARPGTQANPNANFVGTIVAETLTAFPSAALPDRKSVV
jgi:hypothetical protein